MGTPCGLRGTPGGLAGATLEGGGAWKGPCGSGRGSLGLPSDLPALPLEPGQVARSAS